ncbi:sporulation protein YpjB [Salirhabdus euzebyi]|uniref:Sporulation protein YpjB n=1 Tax=Salirhabdus euzebyi TaxID=394506 RepID=A0A841PYR9_9BACI|nr:sporulation protein YpjB [Salirhabdus euzebyi]MBB6452221.1 sporulation protein YpjB [Salirhabdus euzebyi]
MTLKVKRNAMVIVVIVVTWMYLFIPTYSQADHNGNSEINFLDEVYTVYDLTEAGKYSAAKSKLKEILAAVKAGHLSLSSEKVSYVSEITNETINVLDINFENEKMKKNKVYSFVLLMETAHNPKNHLFSGWEDRLKGQIMDVLQSEHVFVDQEYRDFLDLYHKVYPALKLNQPTEKWHAIEEERQKLNNIDDYEEIENALSELLSNIGEEEEVIVEPEKDDTSFVWVLFSVGGAIIFTLIYVGWRKYKGEKKAAKHKNVDES